MAVYKHPNATHFTIDFTFKGERHRWTSATAETRREAIAEQAARIKELNEGIKPGRLVPMTLKEATLRYVEEVLDPKRDRLLLGSIRTYNYQLLQLLTFFGPDTQVSAITPDLVAKFKRKKIVDDGCKPRSYFRIVGLLGTILRMCVTWKALHETFPIETDKTKESRDVTLSYEDEPKLLAACLEVDGQDLWDVVVTALDAGGRRSCLLRLRKKHILVRARKTYFEKNKTMHPRAVPWSPRVEEIMRRRLADETLGDRVFPWDEHTLARVPGQEKPVRPHGETDKRGIYPYRLADGTVRYSVKLRSKNQNHRAGSFDTIEAAVKARDALYEKVGATCRRPEFNDAFVRAVEKAGLKHTGLCFHDLRHTFGTRLAQNNTPPKVIQELMGHKSLKTTERYLHHTEDEKRQYVEALNRPRDPGSIPAAGSASAPTSPSAAEVLKFPLRELVERSLEKRQAE
jgi:integrase